MWEEEKSFLVKMRDLLDLEPRRNSEGGVESCVIWFIVNVHCLFYLTSDNGISLKYGTEFALLESQNFL